MIKNSLSLYKNNWYNASIQKSLIKICNDSQDVWLSAKILQTSDGFVYADVPNSIFNAFLPLLNDDGAEKPPKNERHFDDVGAHITVIKSKEIEQNNIFFNDVGRTIHYKMLGVRKVEDPDGWDEIESVWFIAVESPDLEELRVKYGLTPRIKDHLFHITLAVKPRPLTDNTFV